ncbi:MAG: hypothetical protein ACOX2G_05130 [Bacillota bacterium]|jgi:Tfp pilus assembly protein PilE
MKKYLVFIALILTLAVLSVLHVSAALNYREYTRWASPLDDPSTVLFEHQFTAQVYYEYETGYFVVAYHVPLYTQPAPTGYSHSQSMQGAHGVGYNVNYPVTSARYRQADEALVASLTKTWVFIGPGAMSP